MPKRSEASLAAALYRVSQSFHAVGNLDELIRVVLDQVLRLLDAEGAALWLVDDEKKMLVCRYAAGGNTLIVGHSVAIGKGIVGRVAETKSPDLALDVQSDPRFARQFDKATGVTTRSM